MTTIAEIKRENFELSGGWADHVEEITLDKVLNEAYSQGYKEGQEEKRWNKEAEEAERLEYSEIAEAKAREEGYKEGREAERSESIVILKDLEKDSYKANDIFLMCDNCDATSKTAKMFLLFKNQSDKTTECYCAKHITENLNEYVKELVNGE